MDGESTGRALFRLRQERGLSLADVARRAGIAKATLGHWEQDRFRPNGPRLARVLDVLKAESRLRARLIAAADVRFARIELAHTPLGAPVDVGMVLRAMRARRGMTQSELARTAGLTQSAIAKWESGDSTPSVETVHTLGFALGAAPEETLALASAQNVGSGGVPWDPDVARETIRVKYLPAPLELREVMSLGWEAEMWRRATRDARWEPLLARVLAYRANQFVLDGHIDEIPALAQRALRLATTTDGRVETVPAVSALGFVSEHRGESPEFAARAAQAWAEGIPDSIMRAWIVRSQGMSLVRMGRVVEGMEIVERSIDLEERFVVYEDETVRWVQHTHLRCLAYLAAKQPERADEAIGTGRDERLNPLVVAEVAHANGRVAAERNLQWARECVRNDATACAFAYGDWWSRRRLDRIERTQLRLLDQSSAA